MDTTKQYTPLARPIQTIFSNKNIVLLTLADTYLLSIK